MNSTALQTYLAGVDAAAAPLVVALDEAIRSSHPDFDVAISYKMLMYALRGDRGTWVCAIDAIRKGVCLRFFYGVLLDDPRGVLRAGSSVLKTWDFDFADVVDPAAVGAYVAEAVARNGEYMANRQEVLDASRAAARARRQPKARRGDGPGAAQDIG